MFVDSNALLELKFYGLHSTVVNNVNADDIANIIDFLFKQRVLVMQEVQTLRQQKNDPRQQCRDLLALLHTSGNPQAFLHLYHAIKHVPELQRLTGQIDEWKTGHVESNAILKLKFHGLHLTIINRVNVADIIDFLFQERVLREDDRSTLQLNNNDRREQCRDLLGILHTSEHPLAFVHLYRAVKDEPHLQQLIQQIDDYSTGKSTFIVCIFIQWTDRIVSWTILAIDLLPQWYTSNQKDKMICYYRETRAMHFITPVVCTLITCIFDNIWQNLPVYVTKYKSN